MRERDTHTDTDTERERQTDSADTRIQKTYVPQKTPLSILSIHSPPVPPRRLPIEMMTIYIHALYSYVHRHAFRPADRQIYWGNMITTQLISARATPSKWVMCPRPLCTPWLQFFFPDSQIAINAIQHCSLFCNYTLWTRTDFLLRLCEELYARAAGCRNRTKR